MAAAAPPAAGRRPGPTSSRPTARQGRASPSATRSTPRRVPSASSRRGCSGRCSATTTRRSSGCARSWAIEPPYERIPRVADEAIVIPPGQGHRLGNVEFLARTADTPRFTFGIIEIAPGRELEAHVHHEEDDAFYILQGEMTFLLGGDPVPAPRGPLVLGPRGVEHGSRNAQGVPVGMLTLPARAGLDRRIGLPD